MDPYQKPHLWTRIHNTDLWGQASKNDLQTRALALIRAPGHQRWFVDPGISADSWIKAPVLIRGPGHQSWFVNPGTWVAWRRKLRTVDSWEREIREREIIQICRHTAIFTIYPNISWLLYFIVYKKTLRARKVKRVIWSVQGICLHRQQVDQKCRINI